MNDWKPANVPIDHPYIENTGGGSGCGHWYPKGTYSLARDYRCGYPELDHRVYASTT